MSADDWVKLLLILSISCAIGPGLPILLGGFDSRPEDVRPWPWFFLAAGAFALLAILIATTREPDRPLDPAGTTDCLQCPCDALDARKGGG